MYFIKVEINSIPLSVSLHWRAIFTKASEMLCLSSLDEYMGDTPFNKVYPFDINFDNIKNIDNIKPIKKNSENIYIEISAIKSGYYPQNKRFNLKNALEHNIIQIDFELVECS